MIHTPSDPTPASSPQDDAQGVENVGLGITHAGGTAYASEIRPAYRDVVMPRRSCTSYEVWTMRDGKTVLAYVGIADDFNRRWTAHQRSSWWLHETVVYGIELTYWASREAARRYEATTIHGAFYPPIYNVSTEDAAFERAIADDSWWDEEISSIMLTPIERV